MILCTRSSNCDMLVPQRRRDEPVIERIYAEDREETDSCERGTPGCAIDHTAEGPDEGEGCGTW